MTHVHETNDSFSDIYSKLTQMMKHSLSLPRLVNANKRESISFQTQLEWKAFYVTGAQHITRLLNFPSFAHMHHHPRALSVLEIRVEENERSIRSYHHIACQTTLFNQSSRVEFKWPSQLLVKLAKLLRKAQQFKCVFDLSLAHGFRNDWQIKVWIANGCAYSQKRELKLFKHRSCLLDAFFFVLLASRFEGWHRRAFSFLMYKANKSSESKDKKS